MPSKPAGRCPASRIFALPCVTGALQGTSCIPSFFESSCKANRSIFIRRLKKPQPFLLPVTASLFADRADRFDALAVGHSLGDWLVFLGQLSRAQQSSPECLARTAAARCRTLEQARTTACRR
jgi:hypothetical protein